LAAVFHSKSYLLTLTKMGWATFLVIFSQTHPVTLPEEQDLEVFGY
jgi:hypothetical protein